MMTPLNDAAAPRRGRRVGRAVAGVVFALTPWATLGFGTPVAFIVAAVVFSSRRRAHAVALWISAAVYTAAFVAFVVAANTGMPTTTGAFLLLAVVGGGVQALFTVWLARTGETGPARDTVRRRRATARRRAARRGRSALVIAILGTATLTGGALYLTWANNFAAHHLTTSGTVIAVSQYQNVTVRYQPVGSKPVTFVIDDFTNPPRRGTRLPVYYLPPPSRYASLDNPSDMQDNGTFWITVGLLLLVLAGLDLITAPLADARPKRRRGSFIFTSARPGQPAWLRAKQTRVISPARPDAAADANPELPDLYRSPRVRNDSDHAEPHVHDAVPDRIASSNARPRPRHRGP